MRIANKLLTFIWVSSDSDSMFTCTLALTQTLNKTNSCKGHLSFSFVSCKGHDHIIENNNKISTFSFVFYGFDSCFMCTLAQTFALRDK